jgi:hypothetical protein
MLIGQWRRPEPPLLRKQSTGTSVLVQPGNFIHYEKPMWMRRLECAMNGRFRSFSQGQFFPLGMPVVSEIHRRFISPSGIDFIGTRWCSRMNFIWQVTAKIDPGAVVLHARSIRRFRQLSSRNTCFTCFHASKHAGTAGCSKQTPGSVPRLGLLCHD